MKKPKPGPNFPASNCVVHEDDVDWGGFPCYKLAIYASPTFSEIKSTLLTLHPLFL